jgi:two-component system, LytTR family, response regulator
MKSIIVEDKEYIRKGLLNLLSIIDADVEVIGECESVQEALIVTKTCKPELVFLDINLTDGTAFDFLDKMGTIDFKIIFITAYEEYALRALKIGAIDYLLKPVDVEELKVALKKVENLTAADQKNKIAKAKQVFNNEGNHIILSFHDSYQVINLDELIYCESDKGYTTFYCIDGKKHLVSKTLKDFEDRLLEANFQRPHQSFMINMKFVDKYDKSGTIYLKNGTKIPVSTRKKDSFLSTLFNWNKK